MINGGTALSYTYDAAGNITTIVENGTERVRYRYDELNQLVREDSAVQNKSIEYVYDGGGNLLARKEYAYTTGELGGVMNTVSYGYSGSWKDLLTSYNGTAISYDTIGNPLTWRGGLSFTWQNGRQLSTAQKSGLSLSYTYNASGIRTEKTVNGVTTEYYLDGSSIVAEKRDTDVIWYLYDGMGLAGFELNGTSYYYVYNGQGDVIGILDSSGTRVVTYTYDAWGKPISITGSLASTVGQKNPIRYRGYYYDTETGLYYLQSRYYDPVVGRFLNADGYTTTGQGILGNNMFAYCNNNPVMLSDPFGNCPPGFTGPCPGPLKCKYFRSMALNPPITYPVNIQRSPSDVIGDVTGGADVATQIGVAGLGRAIKNSTKPSNIGAGTHAKDVANSLDVLGDFGKGTSKALGAVSYAAVAWDVGYGIYDNVNRGMPTKKIAIDAMVDLAFTGGSIFASGLAGAGIGAAVGTIVPGAGNIAGAIGGFVVGFGIGIFIDVWEPNGKTLRNHTKDWLYNLG